MTLAISINRRKEIKEAVYQILSEYSTPQLPIKIGTIIRNIKYIKLITYSSQIKKHGISYQELIIDAETKDSYAVRQISTGKYCIYYNDIDRSIVNSNRVRWNLAHELGHVVLKHHEIAGVEKLFREGFDNETYLYLEEEANYFAQLILVPHAALICFKIVTSRDIRNLCKISDPAAKRRYYDYMEWKRNVDSQDKYDKRIFKYYFSFTFKRKCKACGVGIVQRYGKHCPICGNKNTLEWGDGDKMKYYVPETYEDGKLIKCPICHNEETDIEGAFCHICGSQLVNKCENPECGNTSTLLSNARFCPYCGGRSTFFRNHILDDYTNEFLAEYSAPEVDQELPFVDDFYR